MTNYNYVVVLAKPDMQALADKIDAVTAEVGAPPRKTSAVTPDETYIALVWRDVDINQPAMHAFDEAVDDVRHARVLIDLDTCMPKVDTQNWDSNGVDEEFDCLLGLRPSIVLNRMFGKTVTVCDSTY